MSDINSELDHEELAVDEEIVTQTIETDGLDADDQSDEAMDDEDDSDEDDSDEDDSDEDDEDVSESLVDETSIEVTSQPSGITLPTLPITGEPRVDDALARLGDLAGMPVSEHAEVFEDVHRRLHGTLADLAG